MLRKPLLPGEVSFERPRAGVLDADHVGVVRPHVLEQGLEGCLALHPGGLGQRPHAHQHRQEVPPRQHALHHVGSVQTIDAVCPEHPTLQSDY